MRRRADLVVSRLEVDILALQLGLTRKTRIINALEVAGVSKTEKDIDPATGEADKIKRRGFEVELEIPDLRLRRGAAKARRRNLHGGGQSPVGARRERALRGPRGL